MNAKPHHGGDELADLDAGDAGAMLMTGSGEDRGAGTDDDQEGGTTGSASMSGGDHRRARSPDAEEGGDGTEQVHSAGRRDSNVAGDMAPLGMNSAESGPIGPGGGGSQGGPGGEAIVGPDSPAGPDAQLDAGGEGHGDDLANRLGGGEGHGSGLTGGGAVSGDRSAGRSEETSRPAAAGFTPDAGAPRRHGRSVRLGQGAGRRQPDPEGRGLTIGSRAPGGARCISAAGAPAPPSRGARDTIW